jgi:hypothetical protein
MIAGFKAESVKAEKVRAVVKKTFVRRENTPQQWEGAPCCALTQPYPHCYHTLSISMT